jgi:hypothetical protein
LRTRLLRDIQSTPPVFTEFRLPTGSISEGTAHLFIASLSLDGETSFIDGQQLVDTGRVAIVVESGELVVTTDGLDSQVVSAGSNLDFDGAKSFTVENPSEWPAEAFLVGVIEQNDGGRIGAEIDRLGGAQGCAGG